MISQDIILAQSDFLSDTNNHLHLRDSLMLFGLRGTGCSKINVARLRNTPLGI
jgi:hypothetical protein